MSKDQHKTAKVLHYIGASPGSFAVIFKLYLMNQNRTESAGESLIRFFSFFTILTNILCVVCFTALLFNGNNFFTKVATLHAAEVYIFDVGLVCNGVLRILWAPEGAQLAADETLHRINPLFFILYWCCLVSKGNIKWQQIRVGLIYPALYCIFVLMRGYFCGRYHYPFMDVVTLGYNKVLINTGGMIVVFLSAFPPSQESQYSLHHETKQLCFNV